MLELSVFLWRRFIGCCCFSKFILSTKRFCY